MNGSLQAVLFDLGDTLLQFGPIDRRKLFRQAARRTYRVWRERHGRMPRFRRYYMHQWWALQLGFWKLWLTRREMNAMHAVRQVSRRLWLGRHQEYDDAFYQELIWHWYQPLARVATIEPGTHSVLESFRRQGLTLGIVSNTFVPGFVLDRHLDDVGLLDYFPHRIYSCDVGYRKPDRRIFHKALQQTGTHPGKTVFIGDLLHADIRGARRAGLLPIWKRSAVTPTPRAPAGTLSVSRLSDLPDVLHRLSGACRGHSAGRMATN